MAPPPADPAQAALDEMRKRVEQASALVAALSDKHSLASQTVQLYSSILDEIIFETVLPVHREIKMQGGSPGAGRKNGATDRARSSPAEAGAAKRQRVDGAAASPDDSSVRALPPHSAAGSGGSGGRDILQGASNPGTNGAAAPTSDDPPSNPGGWYRGQRMDIYGRIIPTTTSEQVKCPQCGKRSAAARFTTHLERCSGGLGAGSQGTRSSRRAAGLQ